MRLTRQCALSLWRSRCTLRPPTPQYPVPVVSRPRLARRGSLGVDRVGGGGARTGLRRPTAVRWRVRAWGRGDRWARRT